MGQIIEINKNFVDFTAWKAAYMKVGVFEFLGERDDILIKSFQLNNLSTRGLAYMYLFSSTYRKCEVHLCKCYTYMYFLNI